MGMLPFIIMGLIVFGFQLAGLIDYFWRYGDLIISAGGRKNRHSGICIDLTSIFSPKVAVAIYVLYMIFWQILIIGLGIFLSTSK